MLSSPMSRAFILAERLHQGQTRKGSSTPYIAHLMAVSALVMESGGSQDEAIAALLHDAVEDQGGLPVARQIADAFGPRVAKIVLGCSDATSAPGTPKPAWRQRKQAFIDRLRSAPPQVARVVACDKLHNLSCMLDDLALEGPATLARFTKPAWLPWYYASVTAALARYRGMAPVEKLQILTQRFCAALADQPLPTGAADA